jgi:hypothetical protein
LLVAVASRFFEWFWLRSAERAARGGGSLAPRALELAGRAALAIEVAGRTERPAEPFLHAGDQAVAAELYRQAVHWALLAHRELAAGTAAGAAAEHATRELSELLEQADPALLLTAAGGEGALDALRRDLGRGSYRDFAELPTGAQAALSERVGAFARALVEPLTTLQRRLERIWVHRVAHVLLAVLIVVGFGVAASQLQRLRRSGHDLAARAAWKTSSAFPTPACTSPHQQCAGGENFFFHTGSETDPWIQFDLGKDRRISAIEVENRLDCCSERADPLAVAVSSDGTHFKEVARHTGEFTQVRLDFDPVRARYVKLHVPKAGAILHLSRVRIYP